MLENTEQSRHYIIYIVLTAVQVRRSSPYTKSNHDYKRVPSLAFRGIWLRVGGPTSIYAFSRVGVVAQLRLLCLLPSYQLDASPVSLLSIVTAQPRQLRAEMIPHRNCPEWRSASCSFVKVAVTRLRSPAALRSSKAAPRRRCACSSTYHWKSVACCCRSPCLLPPAEYGHAVKGQARPTTRVALVSVCWGGS